MKFLVAFACLAVAFAAEIPKSEEKAEVLRSTFEDTPEGAFEANFETSNGITVHIQGQPKTVDKNSAVVQQGIFEYTAPDGTPVKTSWTADENGFNPSGAHIPTPPPVPEYIVRSLQYIKEHPYIVETPKKL